MVATVLDVTLEDVDTTVCRVVGAELEAIIQRQC